MRESEEDREEVRSTGWALASIEVIFNVKNNNKGELHYEGTRGESKFGVMSLQKEGARTQTKGVFLSSGRQCATNFLHFNFKMFAAFTFEPARNRFIKLEHNTCIHV